MQKEFFKRALSVLGVFMGSLFPVFGQYITVNVDGSFSYGSDKRVYLSPE